MADGGLGLKLPNPSKMRIIFIFLAAENEFFPNSAARQSTTHMK